MSFFISCNPSIKILYEFIVPNFAKSTMTLRFRKICKIFKA